MVGTRWRVAQKRYREFVGDGIANRLWDNLKDQFYLSSEEFIERYSVENKELKEIPRAQLKQMRKHAAYTIAFLRNAFSV